MKIFLPNFFYDLQASQIFKYSKTDIGATIPLKTNTLAHKVKDLNGETIIGGSQEKDLST